MASVAAVASFTVLPALRRSPKDLAGDQPARECRGRAWDRPGTYFSLYCALFFPRGHAPAERAVDLISSWGPSQARSTLGQGGRDDSRLQAPSHSQRTLAVAPLFIVSISRGKCKPPQPIGAPPALFSNLCCERGSKSSLCDLLHCLPSIDWGWLFCASAAAENGR